MGAIITDDAGRLLLIQRGHEPEEGRWSLPGGRVRPGESDPEAVAREVREETGLRVEPGRLVGATRDKNGKPGYSPNWKKAIVTTDKPIVLFEGV